MFISFEGNEGSGKTSQIKLLTKWMQDQNIPVISTREPGGTSIGDQIRNCLHDVDNMEMNATTELLLYAASRAQLVNEVIRPALANGTIVIADRFIDSTFAYQGYGRHESMQALRQVTQVATGGLVPHFTLLLDIDVERGLSRRIDGLEEMNRLDLEDYSFHKRVRAGYHDMVNKQPERWVVIDADRPIEEVQEDIRVFFMKKVIWELL